MPNRRTFLMTAISAGAVGSVCMITALLRPRQETATAPAPTQEPQPQSGPPEPPLQEAPSAGATALNEPPACSAAAQQPIPRANWGALPPAVSAGGGGENGLYNPNSNPNGWLTYDEPLTEVLHTIVVHHSALPLSDGPLEIQRLHQEEKGFADVGYQFLIDENGRLYEGRALNVRGAHTFGQNYGSVGICLIGNFEVIQPSPEQLIMLRSLLACLVGQFPRITRMAGHRDFNSGTLCPGANLAPLLPVYASELGLEFGS
jgi:hypothetical protein